MKAIPRPNSPPFPADHNSRGKEGASRKRQGEDSADDLDRGGRTNSPGPPPIQWPPTWLANGPPAHLEELRRDWNEHCLWDGTNSYASRHKQPHDSPPPDPEHLRRTSEQAELLERELARGTKVSGKHS